MFTSWLKNLEETGQSRPRSCLRSSPLPRRTFRPHLEQLETRLSPAVIATVDTLNDGNAADPSRSAAESSGAISLRSAIEYANANNIAGAIDFRAGLAGTIDIADKGTLNITETAGALIVNGFGASIQVSGNYRVRVFNVGDRQDVGKVTATLEFLTIERGNADNDVNGVGGAGICNSGNLTLTNDQIVSNSARGAFGGGIFNELGASLTLRYDSITQNFAWVGGGIDNGGTMTLIDDTLAYNQATKFETNASFGGGIANFGTLSLTNVTVAHNAADEGGGIGNIENLQLSDDTIAYNSAAVSAGGIGNGGTVDIFDTIVDANKAPGAADVVNDGTFTSNGYNLYGTTSGVTWQGTDIQSSKPGLGNLQRNGGPTETIALLSTSPARDAGSTLGVTEVFDQRGAPYQRIVIGKIDIGAFQTQI
jgi:hypothetical protein